MRNTESIIQKSILEYLRLRGIYAWKANTTGIYQQKTGRYIPVTKGIADILGIMPDGRFLAIEVKTNKGRLTIYQEAFLAEIEQRGGLAIVARSIEDVQIHI